MPADLTRRQRDIYAYLQRRQAQGMPPPNLDELCHALGLASRGSMHKQVQALVAAGLVEPMQGRQRGVRLTVLRPDDDALPLLGRIAAGRPIEAVTSPGTLAVPAWLHRGRDCYVLQVQGESMVDAGILDGDYVIIERRNQARNGEIVVALIDGAEATLKRIEQRPGEVLLHPANAALRTIRYTPDRITLQGVLIGQMRSYRG